MQTLVFFHAHPDDESSQTSGTMALAAQAGHKVIVVFATNGDCGEAGTELKPGETVAQVRQREAACAAKVIGIDKIYWLGYKDSGMTGWEQNQHPDAFINANIEEAGNKLAQILNQESADVLVSYDWHGNYGHPDHIQVHKVGQKALELAAKKPRYLESTSNQDLRRRLGTRTGLGDDGNPVGTPEAELNWAVDVSSKLEVKRKALSCHASQISDISYLLGLDKEIFKLGFGWEFFIEPGRPAPMLVGWPFS